MKIDRQSLIAAGVRNLEVFGYQGVTDGNILTDTIYSAFFQSMLEDNLGKGFDEEVLALIEEIKDLPK